MNGRSIQDIVPPARSKPIRPQHVPTPPLPPTPRPPEPSPMNPSSPKNGWLLVWIAVGAVVVALLAVTLMSTVFHTARAEVTLLEWRSDVTGTYSAGPETALTYSPVVAPASASRTVAATGSTEAKDHASGTIVLSNLYSTKTQRLITNTRFETADGRIYRIHAPITVPGYTTKNGQKVAGTLEAVIYADQPGDKYNLNSGDFKLPGLKGSTQYDLITARTKSPIVGGFVGRRATVEKSVRDQAIADIKAELDRTLREAVVAAQPPASVVFQDSVVIRYIEKPDQAAGEEATITVDGTALAPAFQGDALARALATQAAISTDAPLSLRNPSEVAISLVDGANVENGGAITFTLSGMAHLTAVFNPLKLAEDLSGKTETEAQTVKAGYPALIGPMTVTVYPFWLSTLPENPERISVVITGALDQKP